MCINQEIFSFLSQGKAPGNHLNKDYQHASAPVNNSGTQTEVDEK